MIEIYSRYTSDVIRHDFLKFDRPNSAAKTSNQKDPVAIDEKIRESFEQARAEMANDNGLGSYGTYKCPIY
jgi:hypothetical protein